jgi:hypothetical protein
LDGSPTSGGKDYTHKGEGNDAYDNFIEHLTIDVGNGNPGAIGIDYLANNLGAVRDVTVRAPGDSGAVGIAMLRKWPGPALLQQVNVQGFDTGIAVGNTEYGVTLDHIRLSGQRRGRDVACPRGRRASQRRVSWPAMAEVSRWHRRETAGRTGHPGRFGCRVGQRAALCGSGIGW